MTAHFSSIALAAILPAAAIFAVLSYRLKQARRRGAEESAAWKERLDQELKQSRDERDQLLNALAEAFILVDDDSRIIFANRAASSMFRGRNLIGRTIQEALLDQRLLNALTPCLESGEPITTQVLFPQQGSPLGNLEQRGMNAWVIDAARISDNPAEAPITRVVIRDVTNEHHTEQIRKDFVANASHELRTPLAIINGYLENLLDDDLVEDPKTTRRFLSVMRRHSERISRIVEDMLVISRLESGEAAALKVEPFRIRSCIQDVVERLESMIQSQQAVIHIEMPDDSISFVGDRFYWTQVLFNLVENALKQNPRKNLEVTIGCLRNEQETVLWVADNGVGISSADLPHIFRRFYRVEKHHSQDQIKGTGLGLSIVKRAIEAHGGDIGVTSTPGQETRFSITVPLAAEQSLAGQISEAD